MVQTGSRGVDRQGGRSRERGATACRSGGAFAWRTQRGAGNTTVPQQGGRGLFRGATGRCQSGNPAASFDDLRALPTGPIAVSVDYDREPQRSLLSIRSGGRHSVSLGLPVPRRRPLRAYQGGVGSWSVAGRLDALRAFHVAVVRMTDV